MQALRDASASTPRRIVRVMDPVERMWPVLSRLMKVHTAVYRATGGRIGHRLPRNPPTLLLDHVGAKSATRREIPIVVLEPSPTRSASVG